MDLVLGSHAASGVVIPKLAFGVADDAGRATAVTKRLAVLVSSAILAVQPRRTGAFDLATETGVASGPKTPAASAATAGNGNTSVACILPGCAPGLIMSGALALVSLPSSVLLLSCLPAAAARAAL